MLPIGFARCLLATSTISALVLAAMPDPAKAQQTTFQYAVKFVCGKPTPATAHLVQPGSYSVVVNVHNPSANPTEIRFKVALALEAQDGAISGFMNRVLKPDAAQFFTCKFFSTLITLPALSDGFFVIESSKRLDVTAYYTALGASGPSIAVERIAERLIRDGEAQ